MENPVRIASIGQIAVTAHDLERATAFYRDTLGMDFIFQVPGSMSFFDCGGIRLLLSVPTSPEYDHPASIVYYKVADLDAAHEALLTKGIVFTQDPHSVGQMGNIDVWMAFLVDPEGNTLALMEEKVID